MNRLTIPELNYHMAQCLNEIIKPVFPLKPSSLQEFLREIPKELAGRVAVLELDITDSKVLNFQAGLFCQATIRAIEHQNIADRTETLIILQPQVTQTSKSGFKLFSAFLVGTTEEIDSILQPQQNYDPEEQYAVAN